MHRTFFAFCLPLCLSSATRTHADDKADALLTEVTTKYKSMNTLSGIRTSQMQVGTKTIQFIEKAELKKPNLAHIIARDFSMKEGGFQAKMPLDLMQISDGKYYWAINKADNSYNRTPIDAKGATLWFLSSLMSVFYVPDDIGSSPSSEGGKVTRTNRYVGEEKVDAVPFQVIEITITRHPPDGSEPIIRTVLMYIGKDKLVHRTITEAFTGQKSASKTGVFHLEETLTDIRVNPSLPDSEFTLMPPAGMKGTEDDEPLSSAAK